MNSIEPLWLTVVVASVSLTIGFALLGWVAVVKDPLSIMSPCQAAEFNPFQDIRQDSEVVSLHKMHCYPV